MATENEKELIEKEKTKNENKPKRTTTKKTTTKNTTNKATASKLKKEENTTNTKKKTVQKVETKTTTKSEEGLSKVKTTKPKKTENKTSTKTTTSNKKVEKDKETENATNEKTAKNKQENTEKINKKEKKAKSNNKEEKLANIDMQEIEKTVKQELKAKKVIPSEEQKKMNGEVFKNIFIAIAITIFLNFIILGFINIEQSVFIVDLKVFAVILLATTIGIFEYAYKKDSGKLAIFGIEILVLSLCMLAFIYLDIMLNSKFVFIAILTTYAFAIYYTIKSAIIYKKMKKQYIINSAKEIIKK